MPASSASKTFLILKCILASQYKFYALQRLLNYIKPDQVHVMENGKIIYSGGVEVAGVLEHEGYEGVKKLIEGEKKPVAA